VIYLRKRDKKIRERVAKIVHFSPSRVGNYFKCPAKFGYSEKNYPRMMTDDTARAFGRMVHRAKEGFYNRISENPTNKSILEVANIALAFEWLPRFQSKQRTAKKIMANFVMFERNRLKEAEKQDVPYKEVVEMPEDWVDVKPKTREERIKRGRIHVYKEGERYLKLVSPLIEVDLGSDLFHAKIDFYWNGMLVDWKFGKSTTVYEELKLQLSIEKQVLETNDYPVNFCGLGFLRKSARPTNVAPYSLGVVKSRRMRVVNAIKANRFPRKKGPLCWYCEFYTLCRAEENRICLWTDIVLESEVLV